MAEIGFWAAVLTVGISLLLLALLSFNDWFYGSGNRLPPGAFGWPLVGATRELFADFADKPNNFIEKRIAKYGKLSSYKTHLFGKRAIIFPTFEGIKFVLSRGESFVSGVPAPTQVLGEESFVVCKGAKLKRFRAILMEAMSGPEALKGAIPVMDRHTKQFLAEAASKKSFDFFEMAKILVLASQLEVFVGPTSREDVDMFDDGFKDFTQGLLSFPINLPGSARYNGIQSRVKLQKLLQRIMDQRRATNSEHKDALGYMMNTVDENGKKLTDETITQNVVVFFAASHSPAFHSLLWMAWYLFKNPQYVEELREEHQRIAARKKPGVCLSQDDIRNMPFTKKVFEETLRILNLFPWIFRRTTVDIDFEGITIRKGWMALPWLRALHLDPNSFTDPETFNPHRWNDPKTQAAPFLPFGMGPRSCPGQAQANFQGFVFLYNLTLNYKWEFLDPDSRVNYLPQPKPENCTAVLTPLT